MKTISKNILIMGPQRCGKTSIVNYISSNFSQYEPYRTDPIMIALNSLFIKEKVDKNSPDIVEFYNTLTENKVKKFFTTFCKQVQIDLKPLNKKIILDIPMYVKDAKEIFEKDFDIYCLGMPNETVQNLMKNIRKNDTPFEWTYFIGQSRLEMVCNNIIEKSKILQKECEKYNVPFFDTSGDRKEKLKIAIEEIKKRSIDN